SLARGLAARPGARREGSRSARSCLVLGRSLARSAHQGPRGPCFPARNGGHLLGPLRPKALSARPPPAPRRGDRGARPGSLAPPLVWSAWVVAFFTLSASRLESYGLPALPALAVVVAAYWRRAIDARRTLTGVLVPAWMVLGVGVALLPWLVSPPQRTAQVLT